ncbi:hypothetical protein FWU19_07955 [Bordetella pertussis]|nr:hypothetical protein [Bordetella pertussis]WAZ45430.1 hypothetical protein FC416_09060 [Bordetella pertussis]WDI08878.1 hypothetical protein PUN73_09980 [Bordetella pertussis]WDI12459.1 hypothetical protein PUO32_10020 [Bordetella pertussis]WIO97450.1 hypothetical protein J9F25_08010 [Bordetella pertussis]WIP04748.1 hypothetical protein J9F64_08160 [Bordetella pertussis]
MQCRAGHAPRQGGGVRHPRADFRPAAEPLYAAVDRRRSRPALGPDQGADRLGVNCQ